jgi:hypothetical protein
VEKVRDEGEGLGCVSWRMRGRGGIVTLSMPHVASSSGSERTCNVICTSVRGMARTRMMERRVLCRRSSRWRSRGPVAINSVNVGMRGYNTYSQHQQQAVYSLLPSLPLAFHRGAGLRWAR